MAGKLILITGGARSGKSAFAERLAKAHGGSVGYVATAQFRDGEMDERVRRHRERRPDDWHTFECTGTLADAMGDATRTCDLVLVDCLTMYLARLLPDLGADDIASLEVSDALDERARADVDAALRVARSCGRDVLIVSNELGSGVVPAYPSGRLFRDVVGRANQRVAEAADMAYLVVCGQPVELKALAARELPWGIGA